jgi:hypothetical protein
VGLIVAVPQTPTLISRRNPKGLLTELHVGVTKKHVGPTVVPVCHPEIPQGFDDVWEDNVYLIWNISLGLSAKDGIDERHTIAYRDHLRRRYNPVGRRWLSRAGRKI